MIRIVDASAFIDAVLPGERQERALSAMAGFELWAPAILPLEVASAIWRIERSGGISSDEADASIDHLQQAPMQFVPVESLLHDAWSLRTSLRVSDAFYVAAARALDAELLTSDARLARAPNLGIRVVLLT